MINAANVARKTTVFYVHLSLKSMQEDAILNGIYENKEHG